ncbi:MAG: flagellar filament capping protein FliD [Verrucomicrobia bacterium]|nr:flagellar filament capping protein FliD [Verrucomicrobiota bacterium]
MDLGLSGLASGFDWKSFVEQIVQVERVPQQRLYSEQSVLAQRNNAYSSLKTQLSTLQTRVEALSDGDLFDQRLSTASDTTLASASATADTPLGDYAISVTQFATAASLRGTDNPGARLSASSDVSGVVVGTAPLATPITAGNFTIDGKQVAVESTDTLQQVFDKISTATSGSVTASYNSATDQITLSKASGELVLGSATDTSNFLQATKLWNSGGSSATSGSALGVVKLGSALSEANFGTAVSGASGEFKINGVSITWANTDTVVQVLGRINDSEAGVTATYDWTNDRFMLTNETTGDVGVAVEDVTGNFLAAAGLSGGTFQRGKDLLYSINGGATLHSRSNSITEATSGIEGLSVELLTTTLGTEPSVDFSVSVTVDTSKSKQAIKDFLTEYNKVQSMIDSYTASSTDSKGKVTAGILASESDASSIASSLRSTLFGQVTGLSGALDHLADLGIDSSGDDNSLKLEDESVLDTALAENIEDVKDLFSNSTAGLAVQLSEFLDSTIGDDGSLVAHQDTITKQISDIDTQMADLERLVQANKARLTDSFIAMETAQAQINQQLTFLQKIATTTSS